LKGRPRSDASTATSDTAGTVGRPRLARAPDRLLAQFEQRIPALPLWRGRGSYSALLIAGGSRPFSAWFCFSGPPFAHHRGGQTYFSFQWNVLHARDGISRHLSRALALVAEPCCQLAPLLAYRHCSFFISCSCKLMHVGRGEADSGDGVVVEPDAGSYQLLERKPLPTGLGWWARQSARVVASNFSTLRGCGGDWGRLPHLAAAPAAPVGCGSLVFLQIFDRLTGNYAFFNYSPCGFVCFWLTIMCGPGALRLTTPRGPASTSFRDWPILVPVAVIVLTWPLNALLLFNAFKRASWPRPLEQCMAPSPPRIVNGVRLSRHDEGAAGIITREATTRSSGKPTSSNGKPGALDRAPGYVEPHQPRRIGQMWFAALSDVPAKSLVLRARFSPARELDRKFHLLRAKIFP